MGDKRQPQGPEARERHEPLLELATKQHGVVSTRQLKALGYGRNSASKANRVGRLRRIHRGVYMVGHEKLSWHGRCMAAVLACAPAVASHLSAGWLWGVLRWRPDGLHLTAPTKRRAKPSFVVHCADLAEVDMELVDGIPVTALPRTFLDLAVTLKDPGLERALDRAEELGVFDLGPIDELLSRSTHHPGATKLRAALDIYRPQLAFTRSGLERRFLELVTAAGLPVPAMNFYVGAYELDAYWQAERFGVELDVYETHGSHAAFEADRRREDDLLLLGVETIRVTGPRLGREPRETVERVAAHLERRRRPGVRLD